jgi:ankyrin repeat protein
MMRLYIDYSANVNYLDNDGRTAVLLAAYKDCVDLIDLLVVAIQPSLTVIKMNHRLTNALALASPSLWKVTDTFHKICESHMNDNLWH